MKPKSPISAYQVPLSTKAFLLARWVWVPYLEMEAYLPKKGRILDVGCGHGLFTYAIAKTGERDQVLGVDHDQRRIEQAKHALGSVPNISFRVGDFSVLEEEKFDAVVSIDVLHYMSTAVQEQILQKVYQALPEGGVFLFREVNIEAGALSRLAKIHENVMTKIGFTKGENLNFHRISEWEEMAGRPGFEVKSLNFSRFPFVDRLYICSKTK